MHTYHSRDVEIIIRGSMYEVRASVVHVNGLGLTLTAQEDGVPEISTHLRCKGVLILGTPCASGIITNTKHLQNFFHFFPMIHLIFHIQQCTTWKT